MDSEERLKKQKEIVESIGCYFDKEGLQPIAGRILGTLMVMDKEQYTFEEIVEELKISKGSASNGLRFLEMRNMIEYITHPYDRKRYFQIKRHNPFALIDDLKFKLERMKEFIEKILDLKADKNSDNYRFLKSFKEIHEFFLARIIEYKTEYDKNQQIKI